jgi:hypothetical protein
MLKLPLALLVLAGVCSAQDAHPLAELQGTSRVLIVFAPDSKSGVRQLQLIEHHSYELTQRNTVVVPVSLSTSGSASEDHFSGENLPLASSSDQADARSRFHVQPGEFVVVLLKEDGTEQTRYATPVDIHQLVASLDALPPKH